MFSSFSALFALPVPVAFADGAYRFPPPLRQSLESLRSQVSCALSWPIQLTYEATDDDAQHWAALSVVALPAGSRGLAGLLVSIVIDPNLPCYAVVLSADSRRTLCQVIEPVHMPIGLDIARAEAMQQFQELTAGADVRLAA